MGRSYVLTYPDGHTRTQLYDAEGRLTSRCYAYSNGLTRCYGATYDGVGNPTQLTDHEGTDTVTYDALDRVLSVTRVSTGGIEDGVENYGYNKIGALNLNASIPIDDQRPLLAGGGNGDAAVPNTIGGQPIVLDGEGKITSLGGISLGYNLRGTLTNVAGAAIHRDEFEREVGSGVTGQVFTYDGANRSGAHLYNGSAWLTHGNWLYDGIDHPLEHVDETGARQYYEVDLVGNVRRLVAAGGADLGGYRYTAFGETYVADSGTPAPTGAASLPVRWKGRWLEYSAGGIDFYDMRARWWVPQLGLFVTSDSFGEGLGNLTGIGIDPSEALRSPGIGGSSASLEPILWLGRLPSSGSQIGGPALGAFPYFDAKTTLWGWPEQNPIRFSDTTGHGWLCDWFGIGCPSKPPGVPDGGPPKPPQSCQQSCLQTYREQMKNEPISDPGFSDYYFRQGESYSACICKCSDAGCPPPAGPPKLSCNP